MSKLQIKQKGFSLIEILVSLSLFAIVLTIAVGTLLVLMDANEKARTMEVAMTNLTFSLDSMSREIRTGSYIYCSSTTFSNSSLNSTDTRDCIASSPGVQISFVEGGESLTAGGSGIGSDRISYRFNSGDGTIYRQVGTGSFEPLTSDDITITDMKFVVTGSTDLIAGSNIYQPLVTIYIEGNAGDIESLDTNFSVQTTVSQRLIDL